MAVHEQKLLVEFEDALLRVVDAGVADAGVVEPPLQRREAAGDHVLTLRREVLLEARRPSALDDLIELLGEGPRAS